MLQTVADFLSQVERRSFMPANQATFTEAEILTIASEELRSLIIPSLYSLNEEYGVYYKTITCVNGQSEYDIPEQAYQNTIREVQLVIGDQVYDLERTNLEKTRVGTLTGRPCAFYLRSNRIVLHPTPTSSDWSIKVWFQLTPPQLVPASETAVITAIDTALKRVSFSSIPTDWVTGDRFDMICKKAGHVHKAIDFTSTLVSGTDIDFSELPSDLVVGDYVSITGESSLINLPYAMIPVLAQFTAGALLEYAGQDGADKAVGKATQLLEKALKNLTPRVKGEVQFIQSVWC